MSIRRSIYLYRYYRCIDINKKTIHFAGGAENEIVLNFNQIKNIELKATLGRSISDCKTLINIIDIESNTFELYEDTYERYDSVKEIANRVGEIIKVEIIDNT